MLKKKKKATEEPPKMKKLEIAVECRAWYESSIMVPIDMDKKEAIQYAKEHMEDLKIESSLIHLGNDVIDEKECYFEDED